jgi:hypothetical protein
MLDTLICSKQDKQPTVDLTYLIPLLEVMDSCYIEKLSMTFPETRLLLEDLDYESNAMDYLHTLMLRVNCLIKKDDMPDTLGLSNLVKDHLLVSLPLHQWFYDNSHWINGGKLSSGNS